MKSRRIFFAIIPLLISTSLVACGKAAEDESTQLKAACEELAFSKSIIFYDYRESEFQKSAIKVSQMFENLGKTKPEYLRYSKLAQRYAWEKWDMNPSQLWEVCGLN